MFKRVRINDGIQHSTNYINEGFAVLMLSGNSKIPPKGSNGCKDATKLIEVIKRKLNDNPAANIAIVTGKPSGIVVIDIDVKNGVDGMKSFKALCRKHGIPETRVVTTPSGGCHYYFKLPANVDLRNKVGILPGIDVRGTGGYVVAPPSRIDGNHYQWCDQDTKILELPDWLYEKLQCQDRLKKNQPHRHIENPLLGVSEGRRNDVLFRYACRLIAKGINKDEAKVLILEAASNCLPSFPEDEAEKCLESAWRYNPKFECTEFGNAERLAFWHKHDLKYVESKGWMAWNMSDSKWCFGDHLASELVESTIKLIKVEANNPQDDTRKKELKDHCRKSQKSGMMKSMLNIAKDQPVFRLEKNKLDNNPFLLKVLNGNINLEDGILQDNRPSDYVTKEVPITYDQHADCPRFQTFLDEIFLEDDELIGYIQKAVGYTLTGSNQEQCMFLLYGDGANGKSVFMTILSSLLGGHAVAAPPQLLAKKNRSTTNDLARLEGSRLLTVSEESAGTKLDEALVKQLTGGDRIAARKLYQEHFEFVPKQKIWMATNHLPTKIETDYAIWRRIKVIPFRFRVPPDKLDRDLQSKLLAELPGILNWAIEGCRIWLHEGLGHCEAVEKATNIYKTDSDIFHGWLTENTCQKEDKREKATVLFDNYKAYATSHGDVPSQKEFSRRLSNLGCTKKRSSDGMYYQGICLTGTGNDTRRRRRWKR